MNIHDFFTELSADMRKAGCSPLFMSSSINSAFFGELARQQGFSMKLDDFAFRERITSVDRLSTMINNDIQIEFHRDSCRLGQRYQRFQTAIENEGRRKLAEFQYFDTHCWKLMMSTSIHAFLKEQLAAKTSTLVPIKLLIAKTDVNSSSSMNIKEYADFCSVFRDLIDGCPYLDYMPGQWKHKTRSVMSETLIINYVLKGMPTIILFPVVKGGEYRIECSFWGFDKGSTSICFESFFNEKISISKLKTNDVLAQLALVSGLLIDTYLATEYHLPLFYADRMEDIAKKHSALQKFYIDKYCNLRKTIDILCAEKYLGKTFTDEDLNKIAKSFDRVNSFLP